MRFIQPKALFVVVSTSVMLSASCGRDEGPSPPPLRPVRFQEVYSAGARRTRTFSGTAQADVETILSFRVGGNIQRRLVEIGDRVEAGQLIAELDPTDFELQVQEAEAALNQAEARARQVEADYDRVRGLYENRNASKADLDAARAAAESARAQIDASVKRLEQARSQLSYTRLRAPTAGWIASVSVEINENVRGGQEVAMLTAGSRPQVHVAVPESLIGEIARGDDVKVTFDALPGETFPARVTEVGVAAVELGATFPVSVQLRDETEDVRSGMAADVAFTFGTDDERERFWVPLHAVAEDRDGRFVYVVEPTEGGRAVVRRKTVTIGELTAEGLEVLTGLEDGDRVVTAGVSQIHDGLVVKLSDEGAES
jgi:multidrug efflux system membrane fusion protein